MANATIPSMVIGVDFGMTCTGVAYSQAPRWSDPKTFQSWTPIISELANKVPTQIAYRKGTLEVVGWGFNCPQPDNPLYEVQELFKLNLDSDYVDPFDDAPTFQQARQWYVDYLRCVHEHTVRYFASRIPQWNSLIVEWVFSVPTTWRNPKMVAHIDSLIRAAGYGSYSPLHRWRITLNEAEAAAIAVAREQLEMNKVLVICDAGGGTSDVSVLKQSSRAGEPTKLVPLLPVEGGCFGSALIDMEVQQLIIARLTNISQHLQMSPQEAALKMTTGRFERFKCSFGAEGSEIPVLPLPVPTLPPGSSFPEAQIVGSHMTITREELQSLFDKQVNGILDLIESQLMRLLQQYPSEQVHFIVLSGGLGASPYLRQRILSYCSRNDAFPNARTVRVLLADQPQLAVAHGLVSEQIQMITQGTMAIHQRPSRLNYGIVCDQLYREEKHAGEVVYRDPRDGKRWATGQIEWIIKQGDRMPPEGVAKEFRAKIQRAQLRSAWKVQVVMSTLPPDHLPKSIAHRGFTTLCVVVSSLDGVKMRVKNNHWWNIQKKHSMAEFELRVIPGSADLAFQLWSNERLISKGQENLAVVWDESTV